MNEDDSDDDDLQGWHKNLWSNQAFIPLFISQYFI